MTATRVYLACPACPAVSPRDDWRFYGNARPIGRAALECPACGTLSVPAEVPEPEPPFLPERIAEPGEPLPPLPESAYAPGAVPLEGDRADLEQAGGVCPACGRRACDCEADPWP